MPLGAPQCNAFDQFQDRRIRPLCYPSGAVIMRFSWRLDYRDSVSVAEVVATRGEASRKGPYPRQTSQHYGVLGQRGGFAAVAGTKTGAVTPGELATAAATAGAST